MLATVTDWLQNGHRKVICDFHITSQHKDNFHVTLTPGGKSLVLQTRVHTTFLNAAGHPGVSTVFLLRATPTPILG
jgi:hypothetical protein